MGSFILFLFFLPAHTIDRTHHQSKEYSTLHDKMASNEDEASELSHAHDGLIQRFEMNHPSVKYTCEICYIELDAEIEIMIELYTDENRNQRVAVFRDPLSNPAEWERLGNAIGRCSTIYEVEL